MAPPTLDSRRWECAIAPFVPASPRRAATALIARAEEAVDVERIFVAESLLSEAVEVLQQAEASLKAAPHRLIILDERGHTCKESSAKDAAKAEDGGSRASTPSSSFLHPPEYSPSVTPRSPLPAPGSPGFTSATQEVDGPVRVSSAAGCRMAWLWLQQSSFVAFVKERCREGRAVMAECTLDNESWKPVRVDCNGDGTYYRGEPGVSTHSFRVRGVVDADALSVVSLLLELGLYKEWYPFCYLSDMLAEITRFHMISRFAVRVPWPIANREILLDGFGIDDLDNGRVVVKATSVPDGARMPDGSAPPPCGKGTVRAELGIGGFLIEFVEPMKTRVTFFMNVDPKLPHFPPFLMNFITGQMFWVMLWRLGKAAVEANKPDSPYMARREERPEVYGMLRARARQVLEARDVFIPDGAL